MQLAAAVARAVVYLAGSSVTAGFAAAAAAQAHALRHAIEWIRALLEPGAASPPRLWLVTRGAVAATPGEAPAAPEQATLWGVGKCVALEHPEVWGGLVDLPFAPDAPAVATLVAQMLANDQEDLAAVRPEGRFVERIVPAPLTPPPAPFTPSGTTLITGGLGALGLRVARWLVQAGAKHLVLTSRRGASTPHAAEAVASLERLGVEVNVAEVDVADATAMAEVIAEIDMRMPPLNAVFHAAGIADHAPLASLQEDRLITVLRPKVDGTLVLDALTKDRPLAAFVCFSSIASAWGASGRASYAAANAFEDAWVEARAAAGARVFGVHWGPWASGGMASEGMLAELEQQGVRALRPESALEALGAVLAGPPGRVVIADVEWPRFRAIYEARAPRTLFAELPGAGRRAAPVSAPGLLDELKLASPRERTRRLEQWLQDSVAQVLGFPQPSAIEPTTGLLDLGMDSLTAVQLRDHIEAALGLTLSSTLAFNYPTVAALGGHLLATLGLDGEVAMSRRPDSLRDAPPRSREAVSSIPNLDLLTNWEAERLLGEILAEDEKTLT